MSVIKMLESRAEKAPCWMKLTEKAMIEIFGEDYEEKIIHYGIAKRLYFEEDNRYYFVRLFPSTNKYSKYEMHGKLGLSTMNCVYHTELDDTELKRCKQEYEKLKKRQKIYQKIIMCKSSSGEN